MTDLSPPSKDSSQWATFKLLQLAIDTLPDPIFVKDLEHRWIACNAAFCTLIGHPYDVLIGRSDPDFWPKDQAEIFWRFDDAVFSSGAPSENEEQATGADGVTRTIWTRKVPMRDEAGRVIGLCGIVTDITALKGRLEKVERLEAENQEQMTIIRVQNEMLEKLTVPVIQVWEGILLVPLVGAINDRRAEQVMQSLLEAIGRARARVVLLDVTGLPGVDASVAGYLIRAVQAAQLLGCRSVMVGISPVIAQTLVSLGVNFDRMTTLATLQDGLRYALRMLAPEEATGRTTRAPLSSS